MALVVLLFLRVEYKKTQIVIKEIMISNYPQ